MPERRVAIFVDGANMFYTQRNIKWHIDYKRVYEYFLKDKEKSGCYYFTASPPAGNKEMIDKYRKFRHSLIKMGYTVIDKELREIRDRHTGEEVPKGNLDIEIVLWMITTKNDYDDLIFLGGDGDFVCVVDYLRKEGKRVICVGDVESTATELQNIVNEFIDINTIRGYIEKHR